MTKKPEKAADSISMIKLTVLTGPDAGTVFTPAQDRIVIGRSSSCDVVLHDSRVSRRHCLIQRQERNFVVSDLRTTKGLLLKDRTTSIITHTLRSGDKILFGNSSLQVALPPPIEEALGSLLATQATDDLLAALSLPSNWQAGMTVFAPLPKPPPAPEKQTVPMAGPAYEHGGLLARIAASVQRIVMVLKRAWLRRSAV